MKIMGVIFFILIYLCLCGFVATGRKAFFVPAIWCVPLMGLGFNYKYDMEINGLLVLICTIMFIFCFFPLLRLIMWNTSNFMNHKIIYSIIFIFNYIFIAYCVYEAQYLGYVYDFQGVRGNINAVKTVIAVIFGLILCNYTTIIEMTFFDRMFSKGSEFVLLKCRSFKFNSLDLRGKYYIDGVNNGKIYHFRITSRTYIIVRKESKIITASRSGILGGFYIVKMIYPQADSKIKKFNKRRTIVIIIFTILAFIIYCIFRFFKY